jgi:hypothetical protein
VKIPAQVARELASCDPPARHEGFTVVENRDHDELRWEMVMELVVRDATGDLYRAFYRRGLTENQDMRPFEYEGDEIDFKPVRRRVVETYAYEKA